MNEQLPNVDETCVDELLRIDMRARRYWSFRLIPASLDDAIDAVDYHFERRVFMEREKLITPGKRTLELTERGHAVLKRECIRRWKHQNEIMPGGVRVVEGYHKGEAAYLDDPESYDGPTSNPYDPMFDWFDRGEEAGITERAFREIREEFRSDDNEKLHNYDPGLCCVVYLFKNGDPFTGTHYFLPHHYLRNEALMELEAFVQADPVTAAMLGVPSLSGIESHVSLDAMAERSVALDEVWAAHGFVPGMLAESDQKRLRREVIHEPLQQFIDRFGREPRVTESLFFDASKSGHEPVPSPRETWLPRWLEIIAEAANKGLDPAIIHAMRVTETMILSENEAEASTENPILFERWRAAIAAYRSRPVVPKEE